MQDINTPVCGRCGVEVDFDAEFDDAPNAPSQDGSTMCRHCELEIELKLAQMERRVAAEPKLPPMARFRAQCAYCGKRLKPRGFGRYPTCHHCGNTQPWARG